MDTAHDDDIDALNKLSGIVIGKAIRVHEEVGPGLFERTYLPCLVYELAESGIAVEVEKALPLVYRGIRFDVAYRADLVVEGRLLVELKALDALSSAHTAQMLTYLRLSGCRLGLILNFGARKMREGIRRIIIKDDSVSIVPICGDNPATSE